MFDSCTKLKSLDLSNFDTSNVYSMNDMFYGCSELKSLDLSNFDTSKVESMSGMFCDCSELKSLDLSNFDTSKVKNMKYMFYHCSSLTSLDLSSFNLSQIIYFGSMLSGCTNLEYIILKNLDEEKVIKLDERNIFSDLPENIVICINENFIENEKYFVTKNKNCSVFDCSGDWKSKRKKIISKTNECIDSCKISSQYKYEYNGKCYDNCITKYFYTDDENNYYCTEECPEGYELNKESIVCIKKVINNGAEELKQFEQIKEDEIKNMEPEEQNKFYNDALNTSDSIITSGNYDLSKIDKGEDDHYSVGKMSITFTRSDTQNITDDKMISVHLGACEDSLREHYKNIAENLTFYMRIIDVVQEKIKIPKIEFDVYSRLNGTNLQKLDLSVCQYAKVTFTISVEISDDIDLHDPNSDYFNSKCYSAKSDSGTDMTNNDRKKDFVINGKTLCQENCNLTYYNSTSKKANCSCFIKGVPGDINSMNIDESKLYENFPDSNNNGEISNIGITSCPVLSSSENIKSNPGFFSLIIILAVFVIIFIVFCTKGYSMLENKMDEIIVKKFDKKKKRKKGRKLKTSGSIRHKKSKKRKSMNININPKNEKILSMNLDNSKNFALKRNSVQNFIQFNVQNNITQLFNETNPNVNAINQKLKPDTDYELNWLSYNEALIFDKRTNCEYYGSQIRSKQLFIFTFCSFNDYNSGIIKKFMLLLSFALHYTTNALFFDESNLHQIFEDKGKYNITYQLPKIISSAVISTVVLRLMLQFLVLTDKDILQVKNQQTRELAMNMKEERLKCMKIKFAFFFILNFILLGLFWFYLTCFNAIFKNTQIYLIENTFISFGFSLFYPFIINIFPTIIRMSSLHSSNKNQYYCYKASQIIQII